MLCLLFCYLFVCESRKCFGGTGNFTSARFLVSLHPKNLPFFISFRFQLFDLQAICRISGDNATNKSSNSEFFRGVFSQFQSGGEFNFGGRLAGFWRDGKEGFSGFAVVWGGAWAAAVFGGFGGGISVLRRLSIGLVTALSRFCGGLRRRR